MAAAQYLPLSAVSLVQSFCQYTTSGGTTGLQTDLRAAFGAAGTIQVSADQQNTGNALVVVNDDVVFSVPANNYVTYFQGAWSQYTLSQLNANFTPYFTS